MTAGTETRFLLNTVDFRGQGILSWINDFYNYGGWEYYNYWVNYYYNYCNTNLIGNTNNEKESWNNMSNVPLWPLPLSNSSICCPQQWPSSFKSEITNRNPSQVAYKSDVEINPFLSKPNSLFWQNNFNVTVQKIGPSTTTSDEPKPNTAAHPILESSEPKRPDNLGLSVSASSRPPDLNTHNSVTNDGSKLMRPVERTSFHHEYYLCKIGHLSGLVPPGLDQRCVSLLQKSGAEKTSGSMCGKSLKVC
jgi:hypothetical protein